MKDLYKTSYGVEPSELQKFHIITQVPWSLKMVFGFIVDARIITYRKHYLVVFGIIGVVSQLLVSTATVDDPISTCVALVVYNTAGAFLDATLASIIVQQGRKDPENGQEDLQAFLSIFFGLSMAFGSFVAAEATEAGHPRQGYAVGAVITAIVTFVSLFMTNDIEQEDTHAQEARNQTSFCRFLGNQMMLLSKALREPIVYNFYAFLLL